MVLVTEERINELTPRPGYTSEYNSKIIKHCRLLLTSYTHIHEIMDSG